MRVAGNPTALGRVVRNLLDNAIQHAPAGSVVRIVVDGAEQRPRVEVSDEGPGFPDDFTAHAFERFTRADPSRNRATGGAGLGLAIARGLVEAHGGRIWIGGPPGGRVTFDLPAAAIRVSDPSARAGPPPEHSDARNTRMAVSSQAASTS